MAEARAEAGRAEGRTRRPDRFGWLDRRRALRLAVVAAALGWLTSGLLLVELPQRALERWRHPHALAADLRVPPPSSAEAQAERDAIYALLAYAAVARTWQPGDDPDRRGHNIGAVLVGPEGKALHWGVNEGLGTGNAANHGETALIRSYLDRTRSYDLPGYTVYTTLEPCAMCAGTLLMMRVDRVVWGQRDPGYGKAAERFDAQPLWTCLVPAPAYPRRVDSAPAPTAVRAALEDAYADHLAAGEERSIVAWLGGDEARALFDRAHEAFLAFEPRFPENAPALESARRLYDKVR